MVRAYDISTPWDRKTSLEQAKQAGRPHTIYFLSALGALGAEHGLTVITSRMGYRGSDRMATVLPPTDTSSGRAMKPRNVNMLDVTDPTDAEVYDIHLDRLERLSGEHGEAIQLRHIDVDEAFLYMSHD